MSRSNPYAPTPDWLRAIEEMVFETVTFFRTRGHNRDIAMEQTSLALGISRRRVWAIFYQEPFAATREQYGELRQSFARHLATQETELAKRSEAARLRRMQIEMDI